MTQPKTKTLEMWALVREPFLQLKVVQAYLAIKIGKEAWYFAPSLGYALPEGSSIFVQEHAARREMIRRLTLQRDQLSARIAVEEAALG
jgi:hypothetical protein